MRRSGMVFLQWNRFCLLFVAVILVGSLSGCMKIQVRAGSLPDVDKLETSLRLGESNREEVISVLGKPFGHGAEMLPLTQQEREVLSYYYEQGEVSDDRRLFLFVFIKEDLYDGYLWFSSLP